MDASVGLHDEIKAVGLGLFCSRSSSTTSLGAKLSSSSISSRHCSHVVLGGSPASSRLAFSARSLRASWSMNWMSSRMEEEFLALLLMKGGE